MDPLEWILEFVDKLSAPAKQMAQAVRGLVGNLKDLEKLFERLTAKARTFEGAMRRAAQTAAQMQRTVRFFESIGRGGSSGGGSRRGGTFFGKSDFEALGRAAQKEQEKLAALQWKNIAKTEAARVKAAAAAARDEEKLAAQQWKNIAKAEAARLRAAAKEEKQLARLTAKKDRDTAREATKVAKEAARIAAAGPGTKTVTYKQASQIFKGAAGENMEVFKNTLRGMGVSALDSSLLVRKLRMELEGSRKEAIGLGTGGWMASFRRNIWTLSHALNVFKTVASGLYDTLKDVFEVGKAGVGAFLNSAMFRENTLTSFTEMLRPFHGDRAGGEGLKLFQRAQKFGIDTPMETEDVVKGYQSYLGGGVDPLHVEKMFASSADAFAKFGKEAYESFVHGMVKMQSTGTTTKDALSEMAQGAHLDLTKVYAHLGKMAGFKGDEDQVREQVLKKLGKGEFHSSAGQYAAMMAMSGSEDFGGFAKKQSQTLTGTVSTMKSALTDLLQSVNLSDWAGLKELKASVLWITEQIKPGSAYGERLLKAIQRVIDALFGGLKGIRESGIEGLIKLIEDASIVIAKTLDKAWEAIGKLTGPEGMGSMDKLLEGAGEMIGSALGKALAAALPIIVAEVVKALPGIIAGTFKGAWGAGTGLGKSFQQELPKTSSVIRTALFGPAMAADWAYQKVFGSPTESSALQAYSGKPRGTMSVDPSTQSLPTFDSGGTVPGPMGQPLLAWVRGGERFEGLGSPSRGRGGPTAQIVVNVQVQGGGGDEDSIERAVETASFEGTLRALERIGVSQGLTDASS